MKKDITDERLPEGSLIYCHPTFGLIVNKTQYIYFTIDKAKEDYKFIGHHDLICLNSRVKQKTYKV